MRNLFLLATSLTLSSCSLLDPYKPGLSAGLYETDSYLCGVADNKAVGYDALQCALQKSVNLQTNYLEAAGRHDLARSAAGSLIITGSAYALLLGVADGIAAANSTDQIAAIGAGSAALFGVTSLITSPRRQDVYIAGAQAVSCVQLASAPFLLPRNEYDALTALVSNAQLNNIDDELRSLLSITDVLEQNNKALNKHAESVRDAIAKLNVATSDADHVRGLQQLRDAVDSASTAPLIDAGLASIKAELADPKAGLSDEALANLREAVVIIETASRQRKQINESENVRIRELINELSPAPSLAARANAAALIQEQTALLQNLIKAQANQFAIARMNEALRAIERQTAGRSLVLTIAGAETALATLNAELAETKTTPSDAALVVAAEKTIAAAREAYGRGRAVKGEIDTSAPARTRVALRRIDTAVAAELRKAQPDLSAIAAIQSKLGSVAGRISPGFLPTPPAAPGEAGGSENIPLSSSDGQKPINTRHQLRTLLIQLRADSLILGGLADDIEKRIAKAGDISACGFMPVNLDLRLNPGTLAFSQGTESTKAFHVAEGEPPFVAQVVGAGDKLTAKFDPPFGRIGVVENKGAAVGDYVVVVMEKSGATKFLEVSVGKSGEGNSNTPPGPVKPDLDDLLGFKRNALESNPVIVRAAQYAILFSGVGADLGKADGDFGPNTHEALKLLQGQTVGATADGRLSEKMLLGIVRPVFMTPAAKSSNVWRSAHAEEEKLSADEKGEFQKVLLDAANRTESVSRNYLAACKTITVDEEITDDERACIWEFQLDVAKIYYGKDQPKGAKPFNITGVWDAQTTTALSVYLTESGGQ